MRKYLDVKYLEFEMIISPTASVRQGRGSAFDRTPSID